jgi:hypothetical protein
MRPRIPSVVRRSALPARVSPLIPPACFEFANLAPGTYILTFSAPTQPSQILNIAVAPGADTPVVLVAGVQTGSVRGVVTSAGQAVPAAIVYALAGGVRRATAVTGTDGRYELLLPADTYEIRASSLGYDAARGATITVAAGAQASADVALTRFTSVQGFAKDSSGAVVPGAEIVLSGPAMAGAVAAADGSFSTIAIPPGQYTFNCSAPGYRTRAATVLSIADSVNVTADCILDSPAIPVSPAPTTVQSGAVAWSKNPSVDTISSTGLYAASASLRGSQTTTEFETSTQFAARSGAATLLTRSGPDSDRGSDVNLEHRRHAKRTVADG